MTDAHARLREADKQLKLAAREADEWDRQALEQLRADLHRIVGFRPASEVEGR
jgi:hypothetical protein